MSSEFRDNLLDLLDLLSSSVQQLEYEKNVPHVDITNELVCMWFDDLFHPESDLFQHSFAKEEIEILKEFNTFYDERVDLLPESEGTVVKWHNNQNWIEVMKQAKETKNRLAEPVAGGDRAR